MASAARLLFKSKQLYSSPVISHGARVLPIRFLATNPPAAPSTVNADEILQNIFLDVKRGYEAAVGVFKKEKITIDPEDPAAVSHYAKLLKVAREQAGWKSSSEQIKENIVTETEGIPDARTYFLKLKEIRVKSGLIDEFGAEAMLMEVLDKVEKQLKKPLLRNDTAGKALFAAELDKVYAKIGLKLEDLPKLEEQSALEEAKEHLENIKKEAVESMEMHLKQPEFKGEQMPDTRTLDIRNFL